jgi:alanine-alpha-ketoisovalerate/valine-pyruvate aminotransferase
MVKAISLRVDIELSWSAASLAASSCSQSLFKALIIRGALNHLGEEVIKTYKV